MTYSTYKCLSERRTSVKVLCNKAFEKASNPQLKGCQRGLASMDYKFFAKKIL